MLAIQGVNPGTDRDLESKMVPVLRVYKEVETINEGLITVARRNPLITISYDENCSGIIRGSNGGVESTGLGEVASRA